jgi:hypothetical protein
MVVERRVIQGVDAADARRRTRNPHAEDRAMDRTDALLFQLRVQVQVLARALARPDVDVRAVWRLADAVLDTHDEARAERLDLRAEVYALMRAIAARRPYDAGGVAGRLAAHARALAAVRPERVPALSVG